jgi:hypothetical protein
LNIFSSGESFYLDDAGISRSDVNRASGAAKHPSRSIYAIPGKKKKRPAPHECRETSKNRVVKQLRYAESFGSGEGFGGTSGKRATTKHPHSSGNTGWIEKASNLPG